MSGSLDESAWWLHVMGLDYKAIAQRLELESPQQAKAAVQRAALVMGGR